MLFRSNYCEIQGGNLCFRSQAKIAKELGFGQLRRYIPTSYLKETVDYLHLELIKTNSARQLYAGRQNSWVEPFSAGGNLGNLLPSYETPRVYMSSRRIGKITHRCHSTSSKLVKRLKRKGLIKYRYRIEKIKRITFDEFYKIDVFLNSLKQGFYFYKKGYLYRHRGMEIKFM